MRKRKVLIGLIKKYIEKFLPVRYQIPLRYLYSQKNNKLDDEMFYVINLLYRKREILILELILVFILFIKKNF